MCRKKILDQLLFFSFAICPAIKISLAFARHEIKRQSTILNENRFIPFSFLIQEPSERPPSLKCVKFTVRCDTRGDCYPVRTDNMNNYSEIPILLIFSSQIVNLKSTTKCPHSVLSVEFSQ